MEKRWQIPDTFEDEEAEIEFWSQFTGKERLEILEQIQQGAWELKGEERMEKVVVRIARFDETEDT